MSTKWSPCGPKGALGSSKSESKTEREKGIPKEPFYKPVLAREREARLKEKHCLSMFSMTIPEITNKSSATVQTEISTRMMTISEYGLLKSSPVQYSTIQYNTVQYSTLQYNTIQYSTVE